MLLKIRKKLMHFKLSCFSSIDKKTTVSLDDWNSPPIRSDCKGSRLQSPLISERERTGSQKNNLTVTIIIVLMGYILRKQLQGKTFFLSFLWTQWSVSISTSLFNQGLSIRHVRGRKSIDLSLGCRQLVIIRPVQSREYPLTVRLVRTGMERITHRPCAKEQRVPLNTHYWMTRDDNDIWRKSIYFQISI